MIWRRDLARLNAGLEYIDDAVSDQRQTWIPDKYNFAEVHAFFESLHGTIEGSAHAYSYADYIASGRQVDSEVRDDFLAQLILDLFDLKLTRQLINWTNPVKAAFEAHWLTVKSAYVSPDRDDYRYGYFFNLDVTHPIPGDGEVFYDPLSLAAATSSSRWIR